MQTVYFSLKYTELRTSCMEWWFKNLGQSSKAVTSHFFSNASPGLETANTEAW